MDSESRRIATGCAAAFPVPGKNRAYKPAHYNSSSPTQRFLTELCAF